MFVCRICMQRIRLMCNHVCFVKDITVDCTGEESCADKYIDCGYSDHCEIVCSDVSACKNTTINGKESKNMQITFFVYYTIDFVSAAPRSQIYCPVSRTKDKNCHIICDTGWGSPYSCDSITIFAVEGMNDLVITPSEFRILQDVDIFCGENYTYYCQYGMYT